MHWRNLIKVIKLSIAEFQTNLKEVFKNVVNTEKDINETKNAIHITETSSDQITEIIALISIISDKINLLSLNTAIDAALV